MRVPTVLNCLVKLVVFVLVVVFPSPKFRTISSIFPLLCADSVMFAGGVAVVGDACIWKLCLFWFSTQTITVVFAMAVLLGH